ncbi:carbonic anhydrase [Rhizobium sp. RAF56]|jgi:carbonic anhydrase|uniref:carbonic anhydrase n=1 Tax=Rhizobium sp. RAF56 TaxID=3233062 RepID=UPI003F95E9EE
MERRRFIKGLALIGLCPLCARASVAAEGAHWSYEGDHGPDHWGALGGDDAACSIGSQQSPLNITGAIEAELPALVLDWKKGRAEIVNNGHTIQVDMPPGSKLVRGDKRFEMLQFHFHAPSEHLVKGKGFAMEVHFVHKNADTGTLGVLGVFMTSGAANATFSGLADAFPVEEGAKRPIEIDPNGLVPKTLGYWTYEGSLTTPPCSEIVDWMVVREPIQVAAADIEKFTKLYKMNARPALAAHRRFILSSI